MAHDLDGISYELFKFLNETDRRTGELTSDREATNADASKELGRIYLAAIDTEGYVVSNDFINLQTGNTGIKLGRPLGRGGMNLVCQGSVDDLDALNLPSFFVHIYKHDLRENNGGGNIDKLRTKYMTEAKNETEKMTTKGHFDRIRSETKSVLASKFTNGKCAVRISTSNSAPIRSNMDRSVALDGLVHENLVYSAVRGYNPEGRVVQVLEYVDKAIDPNEIHSRYSAHEIVDLLKQSLSVLCLFKELGMAHRDIKPSNILVIDGKKKPKAKVADLDLMKLTDRDNSKSATVTESGMVKASLAYASPEHINDAENLDIAADICSLGLTTYKWLTGFDPLFYDPEWNNLKIAEKNMNLLEEVLQRSSKPVRPFLVDTKSNFGETKWYNIVEKDKLRRLEIELEKVIAKMIVIDRERRYKEPTEVLADIEKMLHGEKIDIGFDVHTVFGTRRSDIPTSNYKLKRWLFI